MSDLFMCIGSAILGYLLINVGEINQFVKNHLKGGGDE